MKKFILTKVAIFGLFMSFFAAPLIPMPVAAQQCGPAQFTLLPAWYKGLEKGCGQGIKSPQEYGKGWNGWIAKIILNITEAFLYITGYVSLGFIIWGGIKFMIQGDSSQGIAAARKTIQNAVIGLVISIFAVAIVNVVAGAF